MFLSGWWCTVIEKEVLRNADFSIATIVVPNFPYFTELFFTIRRPI